MVDFDAGRGLKGQCGWRCGKREVDVALLLFWKGETVARRLCSSPLPIEKEADNRLLIPAFVHRPSLLSVT